MKTQTDIEYSNDGLWTRFYTNTEAGEIVWRELAKSDGVAAVLTIHAKTVIAQIKAAGYSIRKAKPVSDLQINKILDELGAI